MARRDVACESGVVRPGQHNRSTSTGPHPTTDAITGRRLSAFEADRARRDHRYDSEQRLIEADTPSALVRYEHDHHGNRSARIENGARTEFVIDTNRRYAETVETRSAGGNLIARYAHADELLSQRRAATRHYHHHDGLGSTRALTDDTASERATYDYTPFGRLQEETGEADTRHRFTGEYHDRALGQYYLRACYFPPAGIRGHSHDYVTAPALVE